MKLVSATAPILLLAAGVVAIPALAPRWGPAYCTGYFSTAGEVVCCEASLVTTPSCTVSDVNDGACSGTSYCCLTDTDVVWRFFLLWTFPSPY
jgi:hypothetical protein